MSTLIGDAFAIPVSNSVVIHKLVSYPHNVSDIFTKAARRIERDAQGATGHINYFYDRQQHRSQKKHTQSAFDGDNCRRTRSTPSRWPSSRSVLMSPPAGLSVANNFRPECQWRNERGGAVRRRQASVSPSIVPSQTNKSRRTTIAGASRRGAFYLRRQ